MKTSNLCSVIISLGLCTASVSAEAPLESLDSLIQESLQNHPRLMQLHEDWQASLERVPQARSLDDPMFTYGQFIFSETQRAKIVIAQKFPWFGIRSLRAEVAALEAEAILDQMFAERDEVVFEVKRRYFDYVLLAQRLEILHSQLEILEYIEDTVRSKLALGMASDDELLRVSIARTQVDDHIAGLRQFQPALSRQLSSILGRTSHEVLAWPVAEISSPPPPPPVAIIAARIRSAHPSIAAIQHRIEALEIREELARKARFPDFTIGAEWTLNSKPRQIRPERPYPATLNAASRSLSTLTGGNPFIPRNALIDTYSLSTANEPFVYSDGGEDNLMVSLSLNVPIWQSKRRAAIREARHRRDAEDQKQEALYFELEEAAQLVRFEVEDAARRFELYKESLIPQAEMTYESLLAQYAADITGITFAEVLASITQILEFQLQQIQAATQWQQASAKLDMLLSAEVLTLSGAQP